MTHAFAVVEAVAAVDTRSTVYATHLRITSKSYADYHWERLLTVVSARAFASWDGGMIVSYILQRNTGQAPRIQVVLPNTIVIIIPSQIVAFLMAAGSSHTPPAEDVSDRRPPDDPYGPLRTLEALEFRPLVTRMDPGGMQWTVIGPLNTAGGPLT